MKFWLSLRSKMRLRGAHKDLQTLIRMAITLTPVDFTILEVMRNIKRQRDLVRTGASQTLNSRHLTGHAADLGAYVSGQVRWDWPLYYRIASAMRQASLATGVPIVWGGIWDRKLHEISPDIEKEVKNYVERQRKKGKRAFLDGPHYQLPWDEYPALKPKGVLDA